MAPLTTLALMSETDRLDTDPEQVEREIENPRVLRIETERHRRSLKPSLLEGKVEHCRRVLCANRNNLELRAGFAAFRPFHPGWAVQLQNTWAHFASADKRN